MIYLHTLVSYYNVIDSLTELPFPDDACLK